jgi:hypothetical protein
MGRARLGRQVPGLALDHSIATVLFEQDEAPLNGHISETVIGAIPALGLTCIE